MAGKSTFALVFLCLALGAHASRELQQVPSFTSTGISLQNAADAAANQAADPGNPSGVSEVVSTPVAAPQVSEESAASPPVAATPPVAASPPVVATPPVAAVPPAVVLPPTVPPTQPPAVVLSPPVPAPQAQPPIMMPPPVPAPQTPVFTVPAPAPVVLPIPEVPVPGPVPVPAPAPVSPPLCGQQPQCRLFVEDMLCCESAGAVTNKQHAVMRLQCTHPVNYYPKCFSVSGPSNVTAFSQFDDAVWSTSHVAQMNIMEEYIGNTTIDIESARTDQFLAADCGLFITPCLYNDTLIEKVAPVNGLSFTSISTEDFLEVADSAEADVDNLDSLVFPNYYFPQACQQKNVGELDSTFYTSEWVNYTAGDSFQCNYTAFLDALAPAPAPAASLPLDLSAVSG